MGELLLLTCHVNFLNIGMGPLLIVEYIERSYNDLLVPYPHVLASIN